MEAQALIYIYFRIRVVSLSGGTTTENHDEITQFRMSKGVEDFILSGKNFK